MAALRNYAKLCPVGGSVLSICQVPVVGIKAVKEFDSGFVFAIEWEQLFQDI